MGAEGHDILGGKGTVESDYTFKRAEEYINGLEARRRRELSALLAQTNAAFRIFFSIRCRTNR